MKCTLRKGLAIFKTSEVIHGATDPPQQFMTPCGNSLDTDNILIFTLSMPNYNSQLLSPKLPHPVGSQGKETKVIHHIQNGTYSSP